MAEVIYRADSQTNSRFRLEVNSANEYDTVLHMEIIDQQEHSANGVELSNEDVMELIDHLRKQHELMEDE